MKHIKQFENNFEYYKKYLLVKSDSIYYVVLRVTEQKNEYLYTSRIFKYNIENDKLRQYQELSKLVYKKDIFDVVYQTDDIKDMMAFINTLKTSNEYNL